jgi:P27 family predicted phage terminase small subunit
MKKTKQDEATVIPDPPEHLSERSRELWRKLAPAEARSVERRTLFQAGLEALDRADEARRIIQAEGMISKTTTTGTVHVHPAVKVEREARAQFVRIWNMLNLKWNSGIDGGNPW